MRLKCAIKKKPHRIISIMIMWTISIRGIIDCDFIIINCRSCQNAVFFIIINYSKIRQQCAQTKNRWSKISKQSCFGFCFEIFSTQERARSARFLFIAHCRGAKEHRLKKITTKSHNQNDKRLSYGLKMTKDKLKRTCLWRKNTVVKE